MKHTLLSTASSLVLSALVMAVIPASASATTMVGNDGVVDINPTNTYQPIKKLPPQPMPIDPVNPDARTLKPIKANPIAPIKKAAYLSKDGNTFYDRNGNAYLKDGDIFYDHSGKNNNLTLDKYGRLKDAKGRVYGSAKPPRTTPIKPVVTKELHSKSPEPVKKAAYLSEDGNTFYDHNGNTYLKDGNVFYDHSGKNNNLTLDAYGRIKDAKGRVYGSINPPRTTPIQPGVTKTTGNELRSKSPASDNAASNTGFIIKSSGGSTYYGGDGNKDLSINLERIRAAKTATPVTPKQISDDSYGYNDPVPATDSTSYSDTATGATSTNTGLPAVTPPTNVGGGGGGGRGNNHNVQQN